MTSKSLESQLERDLERGTEGPGAVGPDALGPDTVGEVGKVNRGEDTPSLDVRTVVSRFAHDFNNLLVGIEGNARLLLEERLVLPEGAPLLDQLLSCVEQAAKLTEDMFRRYRQKGGQREDWKFAQASVPQGHDALQSGEERRTVLIIDDEKVVRSVSTAILERAGYEVLTARSGEEGISIYQREGSRILCVLLDLTMPYMSGNLVFAKLKAIDPNVNVFLMSGYNDRLALDQFGSQGILGFIKKPFEPRKLISAIRSVHEALRHEPTAVPAAAQTAS